MSAKQPDITHRHWKGRILIVDDEEDLVTILTDTLKSRGYQVEAAHTVQDAEQIVEAFDAQVALLDIRLGRGSGIDLLARLQQVCPGILCVMMTANATMDTAIEAIQKGAYDYLQKPLDMQYLSATLDRCFEKLRLKSEKAAAEEALRARNSELASLQYLLQNITDSMPFALITLDPAGRVLTWNPAAETLTGQPAAQARGQSLWQTCPALDRYRDLFERAVSEGEAAHLYKEQVVAGTGTVYRDVDVLPWVSNALEGVVLRIDDVTRRVHMEEMMLQSAKLASVGRLAAGVAHEINNPLGAIMQSAQMLQMTLDTQRPRTCERLLESGIDPDGLERYLQARGLPDYLSGIRAMGVRAAKIISDLLSFSRKNSSDNAPHDLNRLVEQALGLAAADYDLSKKYDFQDIEIVRELAVDLPKVACDGQQIQQVVLNLTHNAAQAMAEEREEQGNGGEYQPRLTLRTSLVPDSSCIRLEVEDNGSGIPESVRERLFEPFFTTKEVGEGTGLGLWLCWSIVVERHRGRIWIEPILPVPSATDGPRAEEPIQESGSCFVVELPVSPANHT